MQLPITIGLHRSRFLDALVLLSAGLASGAVLAFPAQTTDQLAILLAIWLTAVLAWLRLSPQFSAIRLERSGQVEIALAGADEWSSAELVPAATVHPWLSVVRLKTEDGRCYTLIATVDSLNREDFRRLRIFLRWRADFSGQRDDA